MEILHQTPGHLDRLIAWRERHLTEQRFVLLLAFAIGLLGAAAALMLKWLIGTIEHLLTSTFVTAGGNYLYLLYPAVGIGLTGLFVRYVVRDDIGHGVTKILYAISQRKSIIKLHNVWTSVVASAVTIGMGGSVGAEAPIVLTGSAIGSNLGRAFRLDQHTMMILLGCGATAGIAGIFKAPIAGLLFTIEVLMLDLTATSIMPLLIAAVTAASVAYAVEGSRALFSFSDPAGFTIERVPFVVLLGFFCGFVSLMFTRSTFWAEDLCRRLRSPLAGWAACSLLLSLTIFLFPPLYGEGYEAVQHIYDGDYNHILDNSPFYSLAHYNGAIGALTDPAFVLFLAFIVATSCCKAFATAATNGGGGCGGTFAPSLFLGNLAGFLFAIVLDSTGLVMDLPPRNFAVMGMAAVMSGVMHAPLMGVFLSAELTGRFDLFLPLLIVACISYGVSRFFEPYSIYTRRLAQKGELITHHKDKAVLTLLRLEDLVQRDYPVLTPTMTLGQLVGVVTTSSHNHYPVCDTKGRFMGMVTLDEIRNVMFQRRLYHRLHVGDIMIGPPAKVHPDMSMAQVMNLFDTTGAWDLPLTDRQGTYLGILSRYRIFTTYRDLLRSFSED